MELCFFQVDAFADRPFGGNPAAVCLSAEPLPTTTMAAIAAEMNLPETAFIRKLGESRFTLHWFTPTREVDLCGHATLAAAFVLWREGLADPQTPVRFATRSGELIALRDDSGVRVRLPRWDPQPTEKLSRSALASVLGLSTAPGEVWRVGSYSLAIWEDPEAVPAANPDFRRLAELLPDGLIVSAPSDRSEWDFLSRFFAPGWGIDEDPVTGSAHCGLGPYWAERLGKTELVGRQCSPRGGTVRVVVEPEAVWVGGPAVLVAEGRFYL